MVVTKTLLVNRSKHCPMTSEPEREGALGDIRLQLSEVNGQSGLTGEISPVKHPAKLRQISKVLI